MGVTLLRPLAGAPLADLYILLHRSTARARDFGALAVWAPSYRSHCIPDRVMTSERCSQSTSGDGSGSVTGPLKPWQRVRYVGTKKAARSPFVPL